MVHKGELNIYVQYVNCTSHIQAYMCLMLCITSCQNQLNLVWVRNSLRKTLFRGQWTGGKSFERRGEVFVSILKTELVFRVERRRRLTLHCGCAASSQWDTWSDVGGTLSHHIQYSVVHVTSPPVYMVFCGSGSVNYLQTLRTLHVFNFLKHTIVDRWW